MHATGICHASSVGTCADTNRTSMTNSASHWLSFSEYIMMLGPLNVICVTVIIKVLASETVFFIFFKLIINRCYDSDRCFVKVK